MTKIFGIGLNKTGTKSLGQCLRFWGFRHQGCRPDWLASFRRGEILKLFDEIDEYDSFEDWPYPLMYRELFYRFGRDAKFILTKRRDAATWLDSLKRHSLRTSPTSHCRALAYNYAYPHGVEGHHLDFYDAHLREVRQFFRNHNAEDQLLEVCWETGDGWQELCGFLDKPVPQQPFPHENRWVAGVASEGHAAQNIDQIRIQLALLGLNAADHI